MLTFVNLTPNRRSTSNPELLVKICGNIRKELETSDSVKYIYTILTSYVVESPPDYEAALAHLHKLRGIYLVSSMPTILLIDVIESDAQPVEDAVRYVIFLVDADKLFDIALGMYDFTLVLLIAQHSQRVSNFT